jgi:hypothetical protein
MLGRASGSKVPEPQRTSRVCCCRIPLALARREDSDDADEGLGGKRNDLGAEEAQ